MTTEFPLEVILDRGYGQVWSRLARDEQDAQRTLEAWKVEGLKPAQIAAGLRNGGDFRIQPTTLPVFRPVIVADKNKKRQSKSRNRQRTRLARIRAAIAKAGA